MSLIGVWEDQFCELAAPGEIVGKITKKAAGTFILNWYIREFGHEAREQSKAANIPVEQLLENLASEIHPGKPRLLMLPHFKAASCPYWDPFARGVVIGLCESTTGAHFYRSIMEGIAFEQKYQYEEIEKSINSCSRRFRN
ncbi:MAG: hypothetical protein KAT88_08185 [Spirochaetes bacterium]|nr:hypothetical protein [Spirochaetota bacterium]